MAVGEPGKIVYSYFLKQISGITRIFETKFEIFWEEVLLFGDAIVIERYH